MSTSHLPLVQLGSGVHESTNGSIRLPPISFLAQEHPSAPHFASLVQPIRHQQPSSEPYIPHQVPARHIVLEPSTQLEAGLESDIRPLPKPRSLSLFPLHSAVETQGPPIYPSLAQDSPLFRSESESSAAAMISSGKNTQAFHAGNENRVVINDGHREGQKRASVLVESSTGDTTAAKKRKGPPILNKRPIDQLIKSLYPERKHLGCIVYNPTTTWQSLQFEHLHGLQEHDKQRLRDIRDNYMARRAEAFSAAGKVYIPVIPPLTEACINSFLEVKIPYRFIKQFIEDFTVGKVQQKRGLWGGAGGLYSDDSDILSVLCHLGLFEDLLDLSESNPEWKPEDIVRPREVLKDTDDIDILDLSVTLLTYPGLKSYHGYFKNGLNSRSWINCPRHDGLSFGVYQVKWETTSMDERNLHKEFVSEIEEDRTFERQTVAEKGGWRFDRRLYERILKEALVAAESN